MSILNFSVSSLFVYLVFYDFFYFLKISSKSKYIYLVFNGNCSPAFSASCSSVENKIVEFSLIELWPSFSQNPLEKEPIQLCADYARQPLLLQ